MMEPNYDYEFSVWPHEADIKSAWTPMLFDLLKGRVAMTFTPEMFGRFRAGVALDGLTLREVTRTPHHDPEQVR